MSLMTLCRSLGTSFVMWNWQSITRHEVLIITFKEHKKKISLFFFFFEKKNSRRRPSMKASKENKEWKANKPDVEN